ncbi:hypothetical protein QFZ65_003669 [Arthrobacter sp. B3I9]|nr:hypothetical protein [Arthrobacter sp. B3I9]
MFEAEMAKVGSSAGRVERGPPVQALAERRPQPRGGLMSSFQDRLSPHGRRHRTGAPFTGGTVTGCELVPSRPALSVTFKLTVYFFAVP